MDKLLASLAAITKIPSNKQLQSKATAQNTVKHSGVLQQMYRKPLEKQTHTKWGPENMKFECCWRKKAKHCPNWFGWRKNHNGMISHSVLPPHPPGPMLFVCLKNNMGSPWYRTYQCLIEHHITGNNRTWGFICQILAWWKHVNCSYMVLLPSRVGTNNYPVGNSNEKRISDRLI